jgi:plastocyanin
MKTSTIIAVVVALIIIVGGWYWYANYSQPASLTTNTTINNSTNTSDNTPSTNTGTTSNNGQDADVNAGVSASVGNSVPTTATVTRTSSGFSPKTITIKKGGTVTFVNQGSGGMWIGSDEHPSHTQYDGTSRSAHCAAGYTGAKPFDQCASGNSYSFTFTKTGTFDYHNHLQATEGGVVKVVD